MFMVMDAVVWLAVIALGILALVFASAGLGVLLGYILAGLRRAFGPNRQNQLAPLSSQEEPAGKPAA